MSRIRGVSNSGYKLMARLKLAVYVIRFKDGMQETQITLSPEFKRILEKGKIRK